MSIKVTLSVTNLLKDPKVLEAISTAPKISDAELQTNVLFAGLQLNDPLALNVAANTPTLFDVSLDYKVKVIRDFDFTKISLLADYFATNQKKGAKEVLKVKEVLEPIFVILNKQNKVKITQSVLPAKAKQNLDFVNLSIEDIDFERRRRLKEEKVSFTSLPLDTVFDKDFRQIVRAKTRLATSQKKGATDRFSLISRANASKASINKSFAITSDTFKTFRETEFRTLTAELLSDIFETKVFSRPKFINFVNTKDFIIKPAKSNISFDFISTQEDVDVRRTRRRRFRDVLKFLASEPQLKLNKDLENIVSAFVFTKPARSSIQLDKIGIEDEEIKTKQKRSLRSSAKLDAKKRFFKATKFFSNEVNTTQQLLTPKSFSKKDVISLLQEVSKKSLAVKQDFVSNKEETNFHAGKGLLSRINFKQLVINPKSVITKNTVSLSSNYLSKGAGRTLLDDSIIPSTEKVETFPRKGLLNKVNIKQAVLSPKHRSLKQFVKLEDFLKTEYRFSLLPTILRSEIETKIFTTKLLNSKFNSIQSVIPARSALQTDTVKEGKDVLKSKVLKPLFSNFNIGFEIILFKKSIRLPTIFDEALTSQFVLTPKNRLLFETFSLDDKHFKTRVNSGLKDTLKEPKDIVKKFTKHELSSLLVKSKSNLIQAGKSRFLKDNLNFKLGIVISSKSLDTKDIIEISSLKSKKKVFRGPTEFDVEAFEKVLQPRGMLQFSKATSVSELHPRNIGKGVAKFLNTSDKLRKAHTRTKYFDKFSSFEKVVYRGNANILKNNFSVSENRDRIDTVKLLTDLSNLESIVSIHTSRKIEEKADAPDNGSAFYTSKGYVSGPYFLEPYVGGATTASHF